MMKWWHIDDTSMDEQKRKEEYVKLIEQIEQDYWFAILIQG